MSDDIYKHADKAIRRISVYVRKEFQDYSSQAGFDELNVIEVKEDVTKIYDRIDKVVRSEFKKVGKRVFEATKEEVGADARGVAFPVWPLILALLKGYNPTTKFVYTREWSRKRERMFESIISSEGNQDMRRSIKRGVDVLTNQIGQYADLITDEVRHNVFKEMGVDEVMWNTQEDERVCVICREREGVIYPISEVPEKHWHCRCYLTPVFKDD